MRNVACEVSPDRRELTIRIDLTQDLGPSKSGKNTLVASTGGNVPVPGATDGLVLGLNVYAPR